MAFFASVVAVAYAGKRGYVANGKAIDLPLISLKKPDVLLVGGVSALVGYFVMQLLTSPTFLGIKADGGAITIFVLSLVAKLWIDNGHLMGKVPDEIKAQGGRFGSNHDSCWLPWQHKAWEKFILGLAWGGVAVAATCLMAFSGFETFAIIPGGDAVNWTPAFITFFISASSLILIQTAGQQQPVTHHITLPAGYAVVAVIFAGVTDPVTVLLWGLAIGVFGAFAADFLADIFHVYGHIHIDPPAMAICISSLIVMYLLVQPAIASSIIIPIIVLVLGLIYAFADGTKKVAAA